MHIAVLRETRPGERRVSLTPAGVIKLVDDGHSVSVEAGAGEAAGFVDEAYTKAGATVTDRSSALGTAGVVAQINGPTEDELANAEWSALSAEHILVALHDPLWLPQRAQALAATGATVVSLELVPRITRAQSMDVLSSMATVTGYRAVLLAASRSTAMFPMLMTAAGTVPAARVVVLGAGVAGLQAIATARRLGAVVEGYDIRPAAMEQIRSLGAKAIDLTLDESNDAEDSGGYAKAQTTDTAQRQQDQLTPYVADADVVITTAAIPGAASPELITTPMVEAMSPGAVIVDLASERGGNCRLSRPDEEVVHQGVILLGPTDLASRSAESASLMFSNNMTTLLRHLIDDESGEARLDYDDEITAGTVVAAGGEVRHPAVRDRLGLPELAAPSVETPTSIADDETGDAS